jgi:hypothetical protein
VVGEFVRVAGGTPSLLAGRAGMRAVHPAIASTGTMLEIVVMGLVRIPPFDGVAVNRWTQLSLTRRAMAYADSNDCSPWRAIRSDAPRVRLMARVERE